MKQTILSAVLVAAALPVMAQQVKYSVSGTYADSGKKVYLFDRLTDKAIDSLVVADGKFSFSGTAAKDAFMAVVAENQNWVTEFFNDGTPITVNLNDNTLTGSAQNERLAHYYADLDKPIKAFMLKYNSLSNEEKKLREADLVSEYNKLMASQLDFINKVFKEERNSLVPLAFAATYFFDHGVEAYDRLVSEQVPFASHPYLRKACDEVIRALHPKDDQKTAFIGQQYTDLEMAAPDGTMHKISELVGPGKWVLVDFWASWCGPCRAEMPNVVEAYNEYHAKGFEVIGVSFDQKKEAWVNAIGQLKMPWLQISDLRGWNCAAAPVYMINSIPDNILIDPQGKIIDRALRGNALKSRLRKIFGD